MGKSSDLTARAARRRASDPGDAERLDPSERLFYEALSAGLHGDAGRMQQLLRRSLRRPPEGLAERHPALVDSLLLEAAQAIPPTPGEPLIRRGLIDAWQGPQPVPGVRFPLPERNHGPGWPAVRFPAAGHHGRQDRPSPVAEDLPPALTADASAAHEPFLPPAAREAVERLVAEHSITARDALARAGLTPTRTVLLTGPPGTGKTMTARWIAASLGRPLLVLDLAALMSNELGRSAQNLTEALDAAERSRGVLFIDEFDAVASARSDSNDVGEMRRLVNVLLMRLDKWPDGKLLLAATNHPELLDRAVGRRFETTIDLPLPDSPNRASMLRAALPGLGKIADVLASVTEGRSGSDLATAARHAARRAALSGRAPELPDVAPFLSSTGVLPRAARDAAIAEFSRQGLSTRSIGDLVGVSHVTVAQVLKRSEPDGDTTSRRGRRTQSTGGSTLAG